MTTRLIRITALTMAAALLVTGCSRSTGGTEATPTVEATTPALEATEPAVEETPEAPPVPTEVGATVPADQVDAAREAGAAVYVSPNGDGEGVVIDPSVTPDAVVADLERVDLSTTTDFDDFAARAGEANSILEAATEAGTAVFMLMIAPTFGPDGSMSELQYVAAPTLNVQGVEPGADLRRSTKEAATAAVRPLMEANPGFALVDLTD